MESSQIREDSRDEMVKVKRADEREIRNRLDRPRIFSRSNSPRGVLITFAFLIRPYLNIFVSERGDTSNKYVHTYLHKYMHSTNTNYDTSLANEFV